jgi:hypothetical protein
MSIEWTVEVRARSIDEKGWDVGIPGAKGEVQEVPC